MIQNWLKKTVAAVALVIMLFPLGAAAQIFTGDQTGDSEAQTGVDQLRETLQGTGIAGTENIGDLILKYVNFSLPYLALAAFVGFVYAGFLYVTAYGNDEQVQKSKKILIYAVAGLVLVILSYSIVQLFTSDLVQGIQGQ